MSDLDKINSIFNAKIDSVKTKEDLQNIKTEFFGKNGQITQQFKLLGSLDPEKRKEFASNLNKIKKIISSTLIRDLLRRGKLKKIIYRLIYFLLYILQ